MHHVIPIEPGTLACVLFATGAVSAAGCVIEMTVHWRRSIVRRAGLKRWISEQRTVTIADGDALFDRWNEAARLEINTKSAQAATVLWGVGAAIQAGLGALAGTVCL